MSELPKVPFVGDLQAGGRGLHHESARKFFAEVIDPASMAEGEGQFP